MDGRTGVVTGAGGDIGFAVCSALGKRGVSVLCVDRDLPAAERAAQAVRDAGGAAEAFQADVSVEGDAVAYSSRCRELYGEASFFFNNAGIEGAQAPLASYPTDAWDRVMSVNLRGVFLGLKEMYPLLRHGDTSRVLNTASVAGLSGTPMLAAYGASKHAVIGLTQTAAIEWAPNAITVNAICPGPVQSKMMGRIEEGIAPGAGAAAHEGYARTIPMARYAALEEVADLATYLLLDCPVYMTGQAIALDGGMSVA
ncbi:MAG: SDR family NAD(P)-dependent oxidoreductase [Tepidiformaceae bacterium]